ncbi:hypothetical protein [Pseudomonas fluorescens]|uniref:hypothetical protein n=1 Tax=Pseudomonas fluorescens TaxID=294 RepID=UPI001253AC77|nr:hypothetical protein [Pseudomonas fluorescens]VVN78600.1 hypothetical protein PS720_00908 [Pseudomonas fluorescens]
MNPDWSKAPQATHYTPGNPEEGLNAVYWRVIEGVTVKAWAVRSSGSIAECLSSCAFDLNRPDAIVKVWDGEGLPPVGRGVCEYRGAHQWDEWTVVNIFASWGKGSSAVVFVDFGDGWREERDPERFRPIRTPEQIAEEARIAELNLMVGAIKDYPAGRHGIDHLTQLKIHEEACINLYDAGWRKQVSE